jgi:hypothetical protein
VHGCDANARELIPITGEMLASERVAERRSILDNAGLIFGLITGWAISGKIHRPLPPVRSGVRSKIALR